MSGGHLTPETVGFYELGAFFLLIAIGNAALIARFVATGRRAALVPIVGGMAGTMAFLLRPELRGWAWSGPMVIGALLRRFHLLR